MVGGFSMGQQNPNLGKLCHRVPGKLVPTPRQSSDHALRGSMYAAQASIYAKLNFTILPMWIKITRLSYNINY